MKLYRFELIHTQRPEAFGIAVDARWYSIPLAGRLGLLLALVGSGIAAWKLQWAWLFAVPVILNALAISHVIVARVTWADGRRSRALVAKSYLERPPGDVHFLPLPSGRGVLVKNEIDPCHYPLLLAKGGWGFSVYHDVVAQALAAQGAKWRKGTAARVREHLGRDCATAERHLKLVEEHFDRWLYFEGRSLVPDFVAYFKRQGMSAAELEELRLMGTRRVLSEQAVVLDHEGRVDWRAMAGAGHGPAPLVGEGEG